MDRSVHRSHENQVILSVDKQALKESMSFVGNIEFEGRQNLLFPKGSVI